MVLSATRLPLPFRLVNAAGATLRVLRHSSVHLEDGALLRDARRKTGLTDFGDPGFFDGLRRATARAGWGCRTLRVRAGLRCTSSGRRSSTYGRDALTGVLAGETGREADGLGALAEVFARPRPGWPLDEGIEAR